jgi:sugar phosphate isomerase/epimerase
MISRRSFLKLGAAGAALASVPAAFAKAGKQIPIALELYSVRKECAQDTAGTIQAVARMGYKGVEFAGFYNKDAKTLRKILDDCGLKCCGSHTPLPHLLGDKFGETVEFNQTLGNKFLIVPGLPKERTASKQAWLDTAKLFNELAGRAAARKMRVGYHNHTIEFKELDGELPWDTFFGNTKKEVIMQFDTGNAMHGGGEAVRYLKKYPGRAATIHLKPFSKTQPDALIGEDDLPWKDIFEVCETIGKTEWYIVEYERPARPALESVEKCLHALKTMGKW